MVLLNMSVTVAVFAFLLYSGIDTFMRRTGRAGLVSNWRVLFVQLLAWITISGWISFYWYSHHADENYWILSTIPLSEWFGIQVMSIVYLPVVFLYAMIVQQCMRRAGTKRIVDYCLTGTMLVHYTLCLYLMANE
jgi:hypothetical protein